MRHPVTLTFGASLCCFWGAGVPCGGSCPNKRLPDVKHAKRAMEEKSLIVKKASTNRATFRGKRAVFLQVMRIDQLTCRRSAMKSRTPISQRSIYIATADGESFSQQILGQP